MKNLLKLVFAAAAGWGLVGAIFSVIFYYHYEYLD